MPKPKQVTIEPWVTAEDVSRHLRVAYDTVYRWIESHDLPAHRVGRHWKLKLSDVDAWVRSGGADDAGPQPRARRKTKRTKAKAKAKNRRTGTKRR